MAKNKPAKSVVKATASAKAEVIAKATYQRKHSTTAIVPPDVTRAKAGAWLDLISPVTEWAGLRGDQLRHKRELLRIQQDETLNRIARLAKRRLDEIDGTINPVPNKFLVPFLERASLEEENSELCQRWADLLVNAATEYNPSMIRFSVVLSEIGAGEVKLLNRIVRKPRGDRELNHIEDVPHMFLSGVLNKFIDRHIEPQKTETKLHREILKYYEYPGTVWPFLGVNDWDFSNRKWSDNDEAIASNLVSVGVLHLLDGLEGENGSFGWYGRVYALTSFGLRFLLACDMSIKQDLTRIEAALERREREAEKKMSK